ncbi:YveK family protein [Neobacillus sp. LXY-4]|uniref:YveK family protein n=1 Tax=Neobacillus sp. LXY-4 TaxID=3379826 RepID=UPI003EE2E3EA
MEDAISIKEIFQTLRKRLILIVVITITAVFVSGVISYFYLTPIYQASTQLLVNQSKDETTVYSPNEVQTNLQLINTYNVIIKSPAILELVIKELDLDMTSSQLNGKITVQSEKDSQVVNISVQDANPVVAVKMANKIAEVFKNEIVKIMNVNNVSILAKATIAEHPVPIKPNPPLNIAIALVIGLMLGVGVTFLLEYLDNTVKSEQDIEKRLDIPVLGVISTIGDNDSSGQTNSVKRG